MRPLQPTTLLGALLVSLNLVACGDNNNNNNGTALPSPPTTLPISLPTISAPPAEGDPVLLSTTFALEDVGYMQQEFFLTGVASAFANINELDSNGTWSAEPAETADYRTRVLMYLPLDAATFSGSVYVEWLNVTTGFELPVSYGTAHTELLREGHAIALLSAQFDGVEGSETPLLPLHLKAVDAARYGSLHHPGDSFSYDMFTQLAGALREGGEYDLLNGLEATHLFAMGQSRSASRLVTYYNAIQPLYQAFDGFMIQNRSAGSAQLSQPPQVAIDTPDTVLLRDDLDTVAINVQGESDVISGGAAAARQPDSDYFRLWEVAGTAHDDEYTFVSGRNDIGTDPQFAVVVEQTSILGFQECTLPMNSGYLSWPVNAAIHALDRWARGETGPAEAARLNLTDDSEGFELDEAGNVTGGLRTSYVDAPAAVLSGLGQVGNDFCFLFGTTALFDAATMASRYTDKAGYVRAVSNAVENAIARGTLLTPDGERIKAAAGLQWDSL